MLEQHRVELGSAGCLPEEHFTFEISERKSHNLNLNIYTVSNYTSENGIIKLEIPVCFIRIEHSIVYSWASPSSNELDVAHVTSTVTHRKTIHWQ